MTQVPPYPLQTGITTSREALVAQQTTASDIIMQRLLAQERTHQEELRTLERLAQHEKRVLEKEIDRIKNGQHRVDSPRTTCQFDTAGQTYGPGNIIHVPDTPSPPILQQSPSNRRFVSDLRNHSVPQAILRKLTTAFQIDLHFAHQCLTRTTEGIVFKPELQHHGNQLNIRMQETNGTRIPNAIGLLQTVLVVVAAIRVINIDLGIEWLSEFPLAVSKVVSLHVLEIAIQYAQQVLDALMNAIRHQTEIPRASLDLTLVTTIATFHHPNKENRREYTTRDRETQRDRRNLDCHRWLYGEKKCHRTPCPYTHDPKKWATTRMRHEKPDKGSNKKARKDKEDTPP
jgi:hypothetical protein